MRNSLSGIVAVRNPLLRMENREKRMKYARTGLTVIVEDEYRLEIFAQTLVSIYRGEYSVMFKILGAAFQPVDTKYCQSLVQRAVTSGKCLGTASFFMIPRTRHILDIKHTISHGWAVPEPGPPPSSPPDSSSDCCCWRGLTSSWPRTELKETRLQRRALEYLSWSVENNYWWLFNDIQEFLPKRVQAVLKNQGVPTKYWLSCFFHTTVFFLFMFTNLLQLFLPVTFQEKRGVA